jgi:crotonobetainyl-CoA:carnitine CoA-transferase CaiB-like acyl-CoA transferase
MTFPLNGIRVADLSWLLAGAGTSTILAHLGAEVIRVEWPGRLEFTRAERYAPVPLAPGKREVPYRKYIDGRGPLPNPNRSGVFNDRNAGKWGITLNLNRAEGRALFVRLVAISDIVLENFSATQMAKWGLGYEQLRAVKPDLIYLQLAGFGNSGPYRDYRSFGPPSQSFAGLSYQSGLPEREPAGWGYSYLDHTPPYYGAMAVMAAVYYRNRTGRGQYIDQAQYEPGLGITGTAILDYVANGRPYRRTGNRSPHLPAAPHGAYRCASADEWIAIGVFSDREWRALCAAMGDPAWSADARFATMDGRLAHQDALDRLLEAWTGEHDKYDLMYRLQAAGVRAGAVQSNKDRVEVDPQLKVRDFFVHLDHSEIGVRPITRTVTPKLSRTPSHPGGRTHRCAPCVGEDNAYVYQELLGLSERELQDYDERSVI